MNALDTNRINVNSPYKVWAVTASRRVTSGSGYFVTC